MCRIRGKTKLQKLQSQKSTSKFIRTFKLKIRPVYNTNNQHIICSKSHLPVCTEDNATEDIIMYIKHYAFVVTIFDKDIHELPVINRKALLIKKKKVNHNINFQYQWIILRFTIPVWNKFSMFWNGLCLQHHGMIYVMQLFQCLYRRTRVETAMTTQWKAASLNTPARHNLWNIQNSLYSHAAVNTTQLTTGTNVRKWYFYASVSHLYSRTCIH